MTSTASTTLVASMTSTASFHPRTSWTWQLDHSWYQSDQYWSLFAGIIKNPIFYWYLISFRLEDVEASLCYFFDNWLQISKYHNLGHLYLWNHQSWYLSDPNYFTHFDMRHPVEEKSSKRRRSEISSTWSTVLPDTINRIRIAEN